MLAITVVNEYVLSPQLADLRIAINGDWGSTPLRSRFARLHGVSSSLFVVNSILALVLLTRWERAPVDGRVLTNTLGKKK